MVAMTDRRFQEEQTRAGWLACWMIAVITTAFSRIFVPGAWIPVLLMSTGNIVFYHQFVRRPLQRGADTARDILLLNNNRAITMAMVMMLLAVCTIGVAVSQAERSKLLIGGFVVLGLSCALAGVGYATKRWKTAEDLERTARESSSKVIEFRSKYPIYFFAAISVIWSGVSRYLGANLTPSVIGVVCVALGSHMLGALIAQQWIARKLLPSARAARRSRS